MPEYRSRLALLISILKEACTSAASSAATSTVVTELDKKASWPLLLRGKMHKAPCALHLHCLQKLKLPNGQK